MSEALKLTQLPYSRIQKLQTMPAVTQEEVILVSAASVNMFTHDIDSSSVVSDLNEAVTPGIWLMDGNSCKNCPPGMLPYMGLVEVFKRYLRVFQRVIGYDGKMAVRIGDSTNGEWSWDVWHVT